MTVKELKQALEQYPDDMEVYNIGTVFDNPIKVVEKRWKYTPIIDYSREIVHIGW